MGLKDLFAPRNEELGDDYIDLDEMDEGQMVDVAASMMVRVAEINQYEDLREFANYVYQGNLLLLDFAPIADDEVILRRVTGDLKKLVADIHGDIAGLGKHTLIVAPTGVKIDRRKQRGGY